MKKTLMCATAAAAFASAGQLAHSEDGWYVRGDVGYSFDGRMDYDAESNSIGSMAGDGDIGEGLLGLSGGLGYDFGTFRIEGTLGGRFGELEPDPDFNGVPADIVTPSSFATTRQGGDGALQIYDLMGNFIYDFEGANRWKPYLGAGVGVAKVKAKAHNLERGVVDTSTTPPTFLGGYAANGFSDEETAFAWQGLAGVGYGLTDRLTLDLGYKYFNVQGMEFGGRGPDGQSVAYDADYSDHTATVGLRWQFAAPPPPPPPPPP
ncbi:MAG: outer membrane beta-barrel protein, partial [Alphaproteobacteria bacterium]|nr:outer membrane beta-barrel protein [Alphaproteobacteria bacterium]